MTQIVMANCPLFALNRQTKTRESTNIKPHVNLTRINQDMAAHLMKEIQQHFYSALSVADMKHAKNRDWGVLVGYRRNSTWPSR